MIDNKIRLRAEFVNTEVITVNTGKKLGVVKDLLVDVDQRDVVVLGLRDNILSLSGMPKYMYLNSIEKTGDVILVEDEDVIEDIDPDIYSKLVNSEVITDAGEPLGRVRDFQFDQENGKISHIIIASLGFPQIPEQVLSTYELPIEQVMSSGPNRLIVFEGAKDHLRQLTVGVLERLGIGRPPWEREELDLGIPTQVDPTKQLGKGEPARPPVPVPIENKTPVVEESWDNDDRDEQPIVATPRRPERTSRYYEAEEHEEDNWNDIKRERPVAGYEVKRREPEYNQYDDDVNGDVWHDDDKPQPFNPPVNIPQKRREKAPEYEEEAG